MESKENTKPRKLTEKERIFCSKYVIYNNGALAAREAGYSEKNARTIATQNLAKLHIQEEIKRLRENFDDHMRELGITKERTVQELSRIAYTNISALHKTWIERKEFEALTEEQRAVIEIIDTKIEYRVLNEDGKKGKRKIEYVKIKLFDKVKAIEVLNKMLPDWNTAIKNEVINKSEYDLSKLSIEALKELKNAKVQ